MGTIEVQNIAKVRDGLWLVIYTHECDCGCTKTRHNFEVTTKPSATKAKKLADDHYNKR